MTLMLALTALLLSLGVLGLYRAWQGRTIAAPRRRLLVTASWAVLALGIIVWCIGRNADIAVPQAVTLAMLLALAGIGAHAMTLRRMDKAARNGAALEPAARPANTRNRIARLVGSLVVVPLLGLAIGMAWFIWVPGLEADRLMGLGFSATLVAAIGLLLLLASRQPARTATIQAVIALVVAGALLPAVLG
jgi:hypothetical protein